MTTDPRERERALDASRSFIVQAPAGSGKTGLLTQRFLRLLSAVERPESIVAVTFTRKAAAEMRSRIYDALTAAAAGKPTTSRYEERTRKLALDALAQNESKNWNLLVDPSSLQIQTIDALCSLLTHQMPVISGFGGRVDVVEDASHLYRMAARRTLRSLTECDEDSKHLFRSLAIYFDNNISALEEQITSMLAKRDQWRFLRPGSHPELVDRFCLLLEKSHEVLLEIFKEQGCVDFSEITHAAIKALGSTDSPSDLLYWLDYRIEHLLIDEFQDTSRAQYDLIEALTAQWSEGDNHSLFLVGDPMQSIYRFREADVSLFLRCWKKQSLGSVRLEQLALSTNFRSTPEILDWIEHEFSPVMSSDEVFAGAVQFRASKADRTPENNPPHCHWFVSDRSGEEAASVVELVRRAQNEGTVAILVRSRSQIDDILPALREAQIEYEAIDIDRLADQQHVLDVISLTRAVLHLADRVAWLACLRAPWCGLSLADLSALAECDPQRTILDLISDPESIARLSAEGRVRALRVQEILSSAVKNAGRFCLRRLIESAWLALGGPAIWASAHQRQDVDCVLDLIDSEARGGIGLDFTLLNRRLDKLFAKPGARDQRVQVMTIFQAKGLEFDTVILPQLGKETRKLEKDLLIWTEELSADGATQLRLAAMPQSGEEDPDYRVIRDTIKQKEEHELKRVFYVACTRARNNLHLLSTVKSRKDGRSCCLPGKGTLLRVIWDSVQPEFEQILGERRSIVAGQQKEKDNSQTVVRRLATDWRLPRFESSIDWQPELHSATASSQKITYEWVKGNARHVGTVVHSLLNRIARDGLDGWDGHRLRSARNLIASELMQLGVPGAEEPDETSKVVAAVSNALNTSRGKWLLGRHAESRAEYPIQGRIQEQLISGVIDRIFRDESGRLWIVDYKTGEHKGAGRESFLTEEERRYRPQLENYATLISRLERGPISLGLYFPLLDGWREWEFAEEVALTA